MGFIISVNATRGWLGELGQVQVLWSGESSSCFEVVEELWMDLEQYSLVNGVSTRICYKVWGRISQKRPLSGLCVAEDYNLWNEH